MIEVSHVTKVFSGSVLALDDISLTIGAGEFVTLLGPSGCGKTTLLRLLAGFDTPTRGRIILGGVDVTGVAPYYRDVNMVFQDYALFPHLSVGRNVAFGLERLKWDRPRIARSVRSALELVELSDKIDRMPNALSGGQKQRVALARAIVRGPKVLLLDEPLSALDAGLREAMQVELKRLHEKLGITFVMVTHDQTEALVMSDKVVLLRDGRIDQVGTAEELYDSPRSVSVASFIGSTNFLEGKVVETSPDRLIIDTLAGRLHCVPHQGIGQGVAVQVGLRPEHLRLVIGSSANPINTLSCRVEDALFHGSLTRFRCAVGPAGQAGQLFWDWQKSENPDNARPTRGNVVQLRVAPRDVLVFAKDSGK
jgi:spermidine/putrescine ABC transporter ATP-binding subunit